MDIKLIVSDIDNTILRTDGTLSPETTAAFELAAAAGVPTVLASSRTPTIASGLLDKVGDLRYMILLTGCRIADMKTGHRIYQRSMERSAALELISYLESQPDCYLEVCSDERFLLPCSGLAYIHRIRAFERYLHDLTPAMIETESVSRYLAKSGAPVDKLFFYTKHRTHFLDICHGLPQQASIRLVSPVPNGLDVLPFGVNKGIALRFLLAQLQLLPEQVMVFGDSENDADMFLDGTFNVAVGNAYPLLKERASFVTRSSDEDGVAYAIRKFVL